MFFSLTGFLTVLFFSTFIILILWKCLESNCLIKQIGMGSLFAFTFVAMARLLFPTEFVFANSFGMKLVIPGIASFLRMTVFEIRTYPITVGSVLLLLWAMGTLVVGGRTIHSYCRFQRFLRTLPVLKSENVHKALESVVQRYKRPVSFTIVQTGMITTPMLTGIRKPTILLPLIDLEEEDLIFIFSHEVAHYYNHNLIMKVFSELLSCLYWWNPFVYLLKKQVDKLLELHTDITVTQRLSPQEQVQYLECLLKVAKLAFQPCSDPLALAFDSKRSSVLRQRFQLVLEDAAPIKTKKKNAFLQVIPLLCLLLFSFTVVIEPYHIAPQDEASTVELTHQNSYLIKKGDSGYDVYLDHKYFATVSNIQESFADLSVYTSVEEAHIHEENP
ncbi:M56 family metallopeptidase [Gorillibacterium sp. CAU 1737]|uniref:M56 family metallopeptidase n=1 Tax=Gorillibacterium sp. CAU 1737 TaxID=3140362 RepID=UPI003261122F